jgi:hypothetical protein
MIQARLDRKTGTRLLCGAHEGKCRGALGRIYFTEDGRPWLAGDPPGRLKLFDEAGLELPSDADLEEATGVEFRGRIFRSGRGKSLILKCGRCGQSNFVDHDWFAQLRPLQDAAGTL